MSIALAATSIPASSSMVARMQAILKQRRIERNRYETELKAIGESERRFMASIERTRFEFVNVARIKREKWWQADEKRRREMAKREFKAFLDKLERCTLETAERRMKS